MPLPIKRFLNSLAPDVPNNIPRNLSFCSFALFGIVLLILFEPGSLRDLTIFIISSID